MASTPNLIFGAGGIGDTEASFTYSWTTAEQVSELFEVLKSLDVLQLDSAGSYPPTNPWNTETLLGEAKAVEKGFVVDTKIAAHVPSALKAENIDASVKKSLDLLGVERVNILYAHAPDRTTPIAESAAALNKHHQAGRFAELGLCNYTAAQVREWVAIAKANDYVKPTVYQGHYNALYRSYEAELFPLLRAEGIRFNAYSPLAGGFLTGKVTFAADEGALHRTRWAGASAFSAYVKMFDQPAVHDEIRELSGVCSGKGVAIGEAALRWLVHHSALTAGDGLILGATKVEQIRRNVGQCRNGPLPGEIVRCLDGIWERLAGIIGSKAMF